MSEIAQPLGELDKTVYSWKSRDDWDRADGVERIGDAPEARLVMLVMKPDKTGGDYKEIDLLHRQLERHGSSTAKVVGTRAGRGQPKRGPQQQAAQESVQRG